MFPDSRERAFCYYSICFFRRTEKFSQKICTYTYKEDNPSPTSIFNLYVNRVVFFRITSFSFNKGLTPPKTGILKSMLIYSLLHWHKMHFFHLVPGTNRFSLFSHNSLFIQ